MPTDLNSKEDLTKYLRWIGASINFIIEALEDNGILPDGTNETNKETLKELLEGKIDL